MILVVDLNSKKNSLGAYEFVLPILSIAQKISPCQVKHYLEVTVEDFNASSSIILSGTPLKDHATLQQVEKFNWLKKTDKPVLGICAGMQTMALVFGLELNKCLDIGMTDVTTVKENPLFAGRFKAYALHNYSATPSPKFEVLAKSEKCIVATKHIEKPIYGLLFHPEVRNPEILASFLKLHP